MKEIIVVTIFLMQKYTLNLKNGKIIPNFAQNINNMLF